MVRLMIAAAMVMATTRAALAAPAPEPASVSELLIEGAKTVSELTVTAAVKCLGPDKFNQRADQPKVLDSFPKKGAVVRPGLLVVRVTFNRPMACAGGFAADPPLQNPCPGLPREMVLSYDRRTVRTVCVVEPNAQYGLWLSQDPNGDSFMGLAGLPSLPYRLNFTTSADPAVATVCDALVQDEETARQIRARGRSDCANEPPAAGD